MLEPKIIDAHSSHVLKIDFTLDSKALISASMDNAIRIWKTEDWEYYFELDGHSKSVNTFALKSDENILFTGSSDKTIKIWDLVERKEILTLEGHKKPVISLMIYFLAKITILIK